MEEDEWMFGRKEKGRANGWIYERRAMLLALSERK